MPKTWPDSHPPTPARTIHWNGEPTNQPNHQMSISQIHSPYYRPSDLNQPPRMNDGYTPITGNSVDPKQNNKAGFEFR